MEIKIIKDVLLQNDDMANKVKEKLNKRKIMMVNIIGSPGSGKTSFILKTIQNLKVKCAVIEGDIASDIDSKKIASLNIPVIQINTCGSCHLNADMINAALEEMPIEEAILFVENVGNLICPAAFDIGEDFKVVLCSITEGDDKPYKYPPVFEKASVAVLNKIDLKGYVNFDHDYLYKGLRILNPAMVTFEVSSMTGDGIRAWCEWLEKQYKMKLAN